MGVQRAFHCWNKFDYKSKIRLKSGLAKSCINQFLHIIMKKHFIHNIQSISVQPPLGQMHIIWTIHLHTNVMGHNSNHLPRNMFKRTHYPPLPPTFGISLPPTFKNSLSQLMQPEIRPSQISVWRNDLLHHQGSLVTSRSNSLWKHFSCFSVFEWNTVLSLRLLIRFGLFLS